MNKKDKQVIEKLLKIAENQQKIIRKLAQQSSDPFWYGKLDPNDPRRSDPLYGGEQPASEMFKTPAKAPTPPANWLDKYMANPNAPTGAGPLPNALPPEVLSLLDKGARGLKNNLFLTLDGKNVNVRYNADHTNMGANAVKTVLQNALPGYSVMDPVGVHNPDKNTWHPNY